MTQKPVFLEGIFTLRNLRSMGAAAIIETLIACGVAGILLWQQLRPVAVAPPRVHPIGFPMTPPVLPHIAPTPRQPEAPQLSEVPPVQQVIPSTTAVPLPPLLPPQAPALASQTPTDLAAAFGSSMLRAINERKVYPKEALLRGETGETVVSFDYTGGLVSDIHVDRSSGFHELDAAAVQAVQSAALPPKPAALAGLNHFVFHLAFNLGA